VYVFENICEFLILDIERPTPKTIHYRILFTWHVYINSCSM